MVRESIKRARDVAYSSPVQRRSDEIADLGIDDLFRCGTHGIESDSMLLHAVEQTEAMVVGAGDGEPTRPQKLNFTTAKQRERQRFPLGDGICLCVMEDDSSEPFIVIQRIKENGHIDRSINLTLLHFLELLFYLDDDSDKGPMNTLELVMEGKQVKEQWHLGGTILMGIESPFKCVHIRKWRIRANCGEWGVPTRVGVPLTPKSFRNLIGLKDYIRDCIPETLVMVRCSDGVDHSNFEGGNQCRFCNPLGDYLCL